PYFVPAEHTLEARGILGDARLLAPEHAVVFARNRDGARATGERYMKTYLNLENYRRNLERLGWPRDQLQPPGGDRLFDAVVAWNEDFAKALATIGDPAIAPARVSADFGVRFLVESVTGPVTALLSGPLRQAGRPVAVGDWIGLRGQAGPGQICHVLPRRSAIRRNAPDTEADEQVLAANIDLVFLASAVGSDFNLRRIERLLTVAY